VVALQGFGGEHPLKSFCHASSCLYNENILSSAICVLKKLAKGASSMHYQQQKKQIDAFNIASHLESLQNTLQPV